MERVSALMLQDKSCRQACEEVGIPQPTYIHWRAALWQGGFDGLKPKIKPRVKKEPQSPPPNYLGQIELGLICRLPDAFKAWKRLTPEEREACQRELSELLPDWPGDFPLQIHPLNQLTNEHD
jgi:hypothetical protein